MKMLFASDSFKGTLSSEKTIELLTQAAEEVFGRENLVCNGVPIADGGEGTTEALVKARNGEIIPVQVHGPLMDTITAFYGKLSDHEAVMEMAAASGLPLVPMARRNPLHTSTVGTGELLKAALDAGFTEISMAIGGSATNDGGMGFASALGVRFFDDKGQILEGCGKNLERICHIDISGLDARIEKTHITVMCDVINPLCGPDGATYTFGKQKGGTSVILDRMEKGMQNYRNVIIREFGIDPNQYQGTGAAGGLGTALKVFCGASMKSGIETVLDIIHFDDLLQGVSLCVTGEGQTDWQSCFGKVMQGVGDHAAKYKIPVIALCGSLGRDYEKIFSHGIDSIMTTVDAPMELETALEKAESLYYQGAVRMFRMIKSGMKIKDGMK